MTQPTSAASALSTRLGWLFAWQPTRHSLTRRLLTAVVLTALAVWLRMAFPPAESSGRFVTASLAVAVSAFYGGPAAALVSALTTPIAAAHLTLPEPITSETLGPLATAEVTRAP